MSTPQPKPTNPGRLDWFHADLRRRLRRFAGRLAGLAQDEALLVAVRAELAQLPVPDRPDDLAVTLRRTRVGREAATAIQRVLTARRLPREIVAWIAWLALRGEDLPVLVGDYRDERIGPHATRVLEPVTGDAYLELRVPADWSGNAIVAALPYLRDPSIFPGGPPASEASGGRPLAIEPADALDLARRFDHDAFRAGRVGRELPNREDPVV